MSSPSVEIHSVLPDHTISASSASRAQLAVDTARNWSALISDEGLTELSSGGLTPKTDLVFVHGLQGHPYRTWAEKPGSPKQKRRGPISLSAMISVHQTRHEPPGATKNSAPYWPGDFLARDFPALRVLTYGYDSRASNFFKCSANQSNVLDHGKDFLYRLEASRRHCPGRPLMFICHSLGGLVVKEALRRSQCSQSTESELGNIYQATFAIIFMGTPHRGSAYAAIGLTATKIASLTGFSVNDRNLRDLRGDTGLLHLLREEFGRMLDCGTFLISTFQEAQGVSRFGPLSSRVVEPESSALDHRFERTITINANHMEMCRFASQGEDGYCAIKNEVERHVSQLERRIQNIQELCLRTLYLPEMEIREHEITPAHYKTLRWLFDQPGPGVHNWLLEERGVFWIQGKPGSGKSTIAKYLYHSPETRAILRRRPVSGDWILAGSFFTDRGGPVQKTWQGILHSMLHQLLSQKRELIPFAIPENLQRLARESESKNFTESSLPTELSSEVRRPVIQDSLSSDTVPLAGSKSRYVYTSLGRLQDEIVDNPFNVWTVQQLQDALIVCKTQTSVKFNACFIIDALDEHEGDHKQMGQFLHRFASDSSSSHLTHIMICVASRPLNQLTDLFDECPGFRTQDWSRADVAAYTTHRLNNNARLARDYDPNVRSQHVKKFALNIAERAQGVFLWVRLVVSDLDQALTDGYSVEDAEQRLNDLPDDLNSFFQRIIDKVDPKYRYDSHIMLESVLRAQRPLTLAQLGLVLFTNTGDRKGSGLQHVVQQGRLDHLIRSLHDVQGLVRRVQSCSGGLLEVSDKYFNPSSDVDAANLLSEESLRREQQREFHASGTPQVMGKWTVQFMHRTVKEYLLLPGNSFLRPAQDAAWQLTRNLPDTGHGYILKACETWLALPEEALHKIPMHWFPNRLMSEVTFHAPLAEKTMQRPIPETLDNIDRQLSLLAGAQWPKEYLNRCNSPHKPATTWKEFSVSLGLHRYVEYKIQSGDWVEGGIDSPLLHQLVCYPAVINQECVNPSMCEVLVKADHGKRNSSRSPYNSRALAVFLENHRCCDWQELAEAHLEIVYILLRHGADPNASVQTSGYFALTKPLHWIANTRIPVQRKLQVIKELIQHGADIKSRNSQGQTLLETLFFNQVFLPAEGWLWLLEHGARVSVSTVEQGSLYDASHIYHPLRQSDCRKSEFYEWAAKKLVWSHNPNWTISEVYLR